MIAKRIIPCLDIKDGRTVKGTNFIQLKDAGDPIELASKYAKDGADELVFLDITATIEKRKTLVPLVRKIAKEIDIPFTVGGGIGSLDLVDELLQNGADKVAVNSAALRTPGLISEIALKYGAQCLVIAVDANLSDGNWEVFVNGGRKRTGVNLFDWAQKVVELGAGEILFTSMNKDGTKSGFEIEALQRLGSIVTVPVIASGGAGSIQDFSDLFSSTTATGGLAASIFHFGEIEIPELKKQLALDGIRIRI